MDDEKIAGNLYLALVAARNPAHPVSQKIALKAGKFLAVIDRVLALDYLTPELRRRVVKLQRDLIRAETRAGYQAVEE